LQKIFQEHTRRRYGHNNNARLIYPHLPLKAGYTAHSTKNEVFQAFAREIGALYPMYI